MSEIDPKPLRWPLATVLAIFLITGLAGCYYYPSDYGSCPPGYGNSGYYSSSYDREYDSHAYHKHAKYKKPKYKHAKYKQPKYKHAKYRRPNSYCPSY